MSIASFKLPPYFSLQIRTCTHQTNLWLHLCHIVNRCQGEFSFLPWFWHITQLSLFTSRQSISSNCDEIITQLSSISTEQTFNRTRVEYGQSATHVNLQNFPWSTGADKFTVEFPLLLTNPGGKKMRIQTILAAFRSARKLLQLSACIESKLDRGNKDAALLQRLLSKSLLSPCLKGYYGSAYKAFACKVILSKCLCYCWLPTGGLTTWGERGCNLVQRGSWCLFTMKWSSLNSRDTDTT